MHTLRAGPITLYFPFQKYCLLSVGFSIHLAVENVPYSLCGPVTKVHLYFQNGNMLLALVGILMLPDKVANTNCWHRSWIDYVADTCCHTTVTLSWGGRGSWEIQMELLVSILYSGSGLFSFAPAIFGSCHFLKNKSLKCHKPFTRGRQADSRNPKSLHCVWAYALQYLTSPESSVSGLLNNLEAYWEHSGPEFP